MTEPDVEAVIAKERRANFGPLTNGTKPFAQEARAFFRQRSIVASEPARRCRQIILYPGIARVKKLRASSHVQGGPFAASRSLNWANAPAACPLNQN
jgi:hypothetical protein